jgi:dihydroxyacid dehydratase/phosphogluconate dehydratase
MISNLYPTASLSSRILNHRESTDLYNIGGTPSLLKLLLREGLIDGSGITVTGKTLAQNLEDVPDFPSDQDIIPPLSNPINPPAISKYFVDRSRLAAPWAKLLARKASICGTR